MVIASRRHSLAEDSTQTQALSPSIMKKKVRNVARSPIVKTIPMVPAMSVAEDDSHASTPFAAFSTALATSGGTL